MRMWKNVVVATAIVAASALVLLPGCGGDDDTGTVVPDSGGSVGSDDAGGTDARDILQDTGGTDANDATDSTDGTDGTDSETDTTDGTDATDGVDGTDSEDGSADVPDVIDTETDDTDVQVDVPDVYVPPTPEEECVAANCANSTPDIVCKASNPSTQYLNDCIYNCYEGTYDGATPIDSPDCKIPCLFQDCPVEWAKKQPVCVDLSPNGNLSDTQDFSNPYEACCSAGHWNWLTSPAVHPGTCDALIGSGGLCGDTCPSVFSPICGVNNAKKVEYGNSCKLADCKATPECDAPCESVASCPQCAAQAQAACAPVCGTDGTTYRNECYMKCLGAGATKDYDGRCCTGCPAESADTLVCDTNGVTHGNDCILNCKVKIKAYDGPCVDGCTANGASIPACGYYQGAFTKFGSAECATLAGATCVYEGDCAAGTNKCADTNQEYDPVCALPDGATQSVSFPNKCNAGCAAAAIKAPGLCADCNTLCAPGVVDNVPHCGPDCVLYPNSCVPTKCRGFDLSELSKNSCPASCNQPE